MVLPLHGVFLILSSVFELSHAGGGGVGKVINQLSSCFLVLELLQFGKGFCLCVCKAADEHAVSSPSCLPWQPKLLQLCDGRFHPLPTNDIFHLGC